MNKLKKAKVKHGSRDEQGISYEYSIWKSMLRRCKEHASYTDCSVVDEWLEFQPFAEWLKSNDFYGLGYDLDKDILSKEAKVYSPETCVLVPRHINIIFKAPRQSVKHDLPIGVCYQARNARKKYGASVSRAGKKRLYLGYFECPQEAHQAYVVAKESYVKEVANKWRGRIDERVYDALMNWRVA